MTICPYCGHRLEGASPRCPACGNVVRSNAQPAAAAPAAAPAQQRAPGTTVPGGITCAQVLLYIQGAVGLLLFLAALALVYGVWRAVPGDFWTSPEAIQPIAVLVVFLVVVFVFMAMPFTAAGRLRRGGRGLAVFIGCVSLLFLPLGTAFGILILLGVFDRESSEWCARQRNSYGAL